MKMARIGFTLFLNISLFLTLCPSVFAESEFKITANIIDFGQVCYITGTITDSQGNPVFPAEITFSCGSIKTKTHALPGGLFMDNPPPCNDFIITATAPQLEPIITSGISVAEEETRIVNLSFVPIETTLGDTLLSLQILSGMRKGSRPADLTKDNRIGLDDAILSLQLLAELRRKARAPSAITVLRHVMGEPKTVIIGKDTDGDGVDDWFQTTVTDENGFLEVDGLSNGTYSLTVTEPDGANAVRMENIKIAGRDVNLKTLRLKPTGSISGNVRLEAASDHSDVHVRIPGTSFDAFTDSEGNFTMSHVPEGTHDMKASMSNHGSLWVRDISVEAGQDSKIESITLPSGVGIVFGTVWLQGALDYTGILVTLRKDAGTTFLTTTNASGEYNFSDIPIGDYELVASFPGYVPSRTSVSIESGENPQSPLLLSVNADKGTLAGVVTLENLDDQSGALIAIAGTQYLAVSEASGNYSINEIPAGTYTVFMEAEGYGAKRFENIQIAKGKTTTLNATLVSAAGTPYGSVVGTAFYLDRTDHSGISIKLEGTDIPLVGTDTNGGFIINNIPAATYTLLFTQANYKTVAKTGVIVPPWNTVFVENITLIPPVGNIAGKVMLEGGTSHDNATVSVNGTIIQTQSLEDGSFLLTNVPEGTYTITAYKADFETARVSDVTVLPGQTVKIEDPITLSKPCPPPTGVKAFQVSGSSVKVQWTESDCDDLAGYNVFYSPQSNLIDHKANSVLVVADEFVVEGLSKGVTYYFAVEALDNDGLISQLSQYISTEIVPRQPIPPAPSEIFYGEFPFASPDAICISRDGRWAYVTNPPIKKLALIDLEAGGGPEVIGWIEVGPESLDIAANPLRDEVYCLNYENNTISVIDTNLTEIPPLELDDIPAVKATYTTPPNPVRCLVSPDGNYLFVACHGTEPDSISIINLDNGNQIKEFPIPVGSQPEGMVVANEKLYVANWSDNDITVIDVDPNSQTRWEKLPYSIPVGFSPIALATRPDGKYVYVANSGSNDVSIIDTTTDVVIDPPLKVGEYPIRTTTADNILYITNWEDDSVSMINMNTNTVLSANIQVGQLPKGIAVSRDGESIFVVNQSSQTVSIRQY